jgi:hypothetical protein
VAKPYKPKNIQSKSLSTDSGIQVNMKPNGQSSTNGLTIKRKSSSTSTTSNDNPKIPKLILRLPKSKDGIVSIKEISNTEANTNTATTTISTSAIKFPAKMEVLHTQNDFQHAHNS